MTAFVMYGVKYSQLWRKVVLPVIVRLEQAPHFGASVRLCHELKRSFQQRIYSVFKSDFFCG